MRGSQAVGVSTVGTAPGLSSLGVWWRWGGAIPLVPSSSFLLHTLFFTTVLGPHQNFPGPFFGLGTLHWRQSLTFYDQGDKA